MPINPLLFGHPHLFLTDVAFTNISGPVICFLKSLPDHCLGSLNTSRSDAGTTRATRIQTVRDAETLGIIAGHQRGTGGRTSIA